MSNSNSQNVRASVAWFSTQMEAKLAKNDHKGGWASCDVRWLLQRLKEETKELEHVLDMRDLEKGYRSAGEGLVLIDTDNEAVVSEAVDIANFAMMIADLYGQKHGR